MMESKIAIRVTFLVWVATFVVGAALLAGCGSAGTAEEVRKAESWCKNQTVSEAEAGEFGDGSDYDAAEFAEAVEEAYDDCFDTRVDYYVDHPDAP